MGTACGDASGVARGKGRRARAKLRSAFPLDRLFAARAVRTTSRGEGRAESPDVDCFQDVLRGKLSPAARKVLELAIHLRDTHDDLLVHFHKRLRRGRAVTKDHLRKLMLHASIAFEHETNASISAFDAGLSGITEHFHFLNSYFDLGQLCDWVAAREEPQAPGTDVEDLQFRLFFGALCRALQGRKPSHSDGRRLARPGRHAARRDLAGSIGFTKARRGADCGQR